MTDNDLLARLPEQYEWSEPAERAARRKAALAADPTLAADLALAAAIGRLPKDFTIDIRYEPPPEPVAWTVRVADRFVGSESLTDAITAALEGDTDD